MTREDDYRKMRELNENGELMDFHDRIYRQPRQRLREILMRDLKGEFRTC